MSDLNRLEAGITIVTGTDTEVGKTVVTATLARWLQHRGHDVVVCKPAQTGVEPGEPADLTQIGHLAGLAPARLIEFSRLAEPLAPTTAARRAGQSLPSVAVMAGRLKRLAEAGHPILIEGAGGVLVGLDDEGAGVLELADAFGGARFVVVCRSGLGTLNHTALTCQAIRARGHEVTGLIVGAWPEKPDLAERCNLTDLASIAPLLAKIPAGVGDDPSAVRRCAKELR